MLQKLKLECILKVCTIIFIVGISYKYGYDRCNIKWNKRIINEYITRQEATQKAQEQINQISKDYQEKLSEIEGSTDRIINDLRISDKRLRVKLSDSYARKQKDNCGCILNGKAELDQEFSRRIIGITKKGDLWIEALQNTIRQMQDQQEVKH